MRSYQFYLDSLLFPVETVGFEPTDPCGSNDFELESLSGL